MDVKSKNGTGETGFLQKEDPIRGAHNTVVSLKTRKTLIKSFVWSVALTIWGRNMDDTERGRKMN